MVKKVAIAIALGVALFVGIGVFRHIFGVQNFHITRFPVAENIAVGTLVGALVAALVSRRQSIISAVRNSVWYTAIVFAVAAVIEHAFGKRIGGHFHLSPFGGVEHFLKVHNFPIPHFHLGSDLVVVAAAVLATLLTLRAGGKQKSGDAA